MKKLISAIALLGFAAAPLAAQTVVRLGTEGDYPPWNFINENNEVDGFERELGDELCRRAELNCVWVVNDWDSIIPNLVSGNYDAIIAGMSVTDARSEVIDFSEWYLPPDPSAYFALAGTGPEAMMGAVGTQVSTVFAEYLAGTESTLVEFTSADDIVSAVMGGVVDAGLFDRAFLDPIISESDGALVYISDDLFLANGVAMGFRKSDPQLRETFSRVIIEMKAEGALNEMITRWFGDDFPTFD